MIYSATPGYSKIAAIHSPHLHFSVLYKNKEKILKQTEDLSPEVLNAMVACEQAKEYIHAMDIYDDDSNAILDLSLYFKVDEKTGKLKLTKDYKRRHLTYSLTKELLSYKNLRDATRWVVYVLYYYEFFRSETKENMNAAVVAGIASLITNIIEKEYTTYKAFDTAAALNSLRWALESEKVMKLGSRTYK